MEREYKDMLGNKLKVTFYLSGFNDDITCCDIYKEVKSPLARFFGYKWAKVYSSVSTASLNTVATWDEHDYHKFALNSIKKYNQEVAVMDVVVNNMNKYNTL
jgi:hypothetical protein